MRSQQMQFLENVNTELQQVIQVAQKDFNEVNALLKLHYDNTKKDKINQSHFAHFQLKLETIVGGLQYMDIFSQRVEHLIITHQQMMVNGLAAEFEESFFHLHVFQSMTIELDLIRAINSINSLLDESRDYLNGIGRVYWTDQVFFSHTPIIKNILRVTMEKLAKAGGDAQHLPIPALTSEQIRMLNSLYTMESERIVLAWFLEAMPKGTWDDLLHQYESAIYQVDPENTELF